MEVLRALALVFPVLVVLLAVLVTPANVAGKRQTPGAAAGGIVTNILIACCVIYLWAT